MRIVAVVLAAGDSQRMGTDKLALRFGGRSVLESAVLPFVDAVRVHEVIVVRRPGQSLPESLVGCRLVECAGHRDGMGASLNAGVAAAEADILLLSLADLPRMSVAIVDAVLDAVGEHPGQIIVPTHRGRRGHPVAMPARFRDEVLAVRGDVGAREILKRGAGDLVLLPVSGAGSIEDIDLPEDLRCVGGQGATVEQ